MESIGQESQASAEPYFFNQNSVMVMRILDNIQADFEDSFSYRLSKPLIRRLIANDFPFPTTPPMPHPPTHEQIETEERLSNVEDETDMKIRDYLASKDKLICSVLCIVTKFENSILQNNIVTLKERTEFSQYVKTIVLAMIENREQIARLHAESLASIVLLLAAKKIGMKKTNFLLGTRGVILRPRIIDISALQKTIGYSKVKGLLR